MSTNNKAVEDFMRQLVSLSSSNNVKIEIEYQTLGLVAIGVRRGEFAHATWLPLDHLYGAKVIDSIIYSIGEVDKMMLEFKKKELAAKEKPLKAKFPPKENK